MRFKGTNAFAHPGIKEEEEARMLFDAKRQDRFATKLFHSHTLSMLITFAKGYLVHLNPETLFFGKGAPYNYAPNVGLFYIFELPFIIWGAHQLLSHLGKSHQLILAWFLLSPVASALTYDIPSSTRTMLMLPPLLYASSTGIISLLIQLKNRILLQKAFIAVLFIVMVFQFGYYLHQYAVHSPIENASAWQYGYKQAVIYLNESLSQYKKVIVSTNLRQPQNFFTFYLQYDPKTYIEVDGGTISGGFLESKNKFDRYEFHEIDYQTIEQTSDVIIVDLYKNMSESLLKKQLKIINLPNGQPEIAIAKT
jgi:hypothetical protein